ncbi:MAG TPA: cupin domain-containing protein [bacterium]|nr:cupin domain-containing protein [bacterium]
MRMLVVGRGALFAASILLVLVALGPSGVQAQAPRQLPLFPSAVFRGVPTPARYFYLAMAVVEYVPGAVLPAGSERSRRFFTVIEGEIAFTVGGKTDVYGIGKSVTVAPGVVVAGRNGGRATARAVVSSLVPASGEGATILTGSTTSPTPRTLHAMRMPVGPLPEVIDVIQGGTRYEPGFVTGTHIMNETHAIIHLEGTTSYEYVDGTQEAFGPGQAGQMYVGRPGVMASRTSAPSTWLITWLATPGKPLTSPWTSTGH